MNIIDYSQENISSYKELQRAYASTSKIYKAHGMIYKMLYESDIDVLKEKEEKLELFSSIDKDYLLTLDSKIMDHNILKGYTSYFIKGNHLDDVFSSLDIETQKEILLKLSSTLKDFHEISGRPVFGDLHFKNILLDSSYFIHFLDIDSYGIYDYKADFLPAFMYYYCQSLDYKILKNQNTDRICLYTSLLHTIFKKSIFSISDSEYENMCLKYPYLKDMEELWYLLTHRYKSLPEFPYVHQLIKK